MTDSEPHVVIIGSEDDVTHLDRSCTVVSVMSGTYFALLIVSAACLQGSEDDIPGQVFYYLFMALIFGIYAYLEIWGSALMDKKTVEYYRTIMSSVVVCLLFSFLMWYQQPKSVFSASVASQLFLGFTNILLFVFTTNHMYQQLWRGKEDVQEAISAINKY